MLNTGLDYFQRKSDSFHDADGIQLIWLIGIIIPVAVVWVDIGRTEKTDYIVENQSLSGNILEYREFIDGK